MKNILGKLIYVCVLLLFMTIVLHKNVTAKENDSKELSYDWEISSDNVTIISTQRLKKLYENHESLGIMGDGYTIILRGEDIVNCQNRLYTDIRLQQEDIGTTFEVNQGNPLCGNITIELSDNVGKYVYLYNNVSERYEQLNVEDTQCLSITSAGKYLITNHRLQQDYGWIAYMLIVSAIIIAGGGIAYIVVKKRYWFW